MEQLSAIEHATLSFYQWEERGRGYMHYPFPVALEPVLEPFIIPPYLHSQRQSKDPGEKTSIFDTFKSGVKSLLDNPQLPVQEQEEERIYSYPDKPIPFTVYEPLIAYRITAPKQFELHAEEAIRFLSMVSYSHAPYSFEIIGTHNEVYIQYVVRQSDATNFLSQFRSYFPNVAIEEVSSSELPMNIEQDMALVDMGLSEEFMRPIQSVRSFNPDPLIGILASFEQLQFGEVGMIQILFQGSINPWGSIITEAVTDGRGGSFFADAPEMVKLAQEKTSQPLYATIVRAIGQGSSATRSEHITSQLVRTLSASTRSSYNQLIPLSNKGYDYHHHLKSVYFRQSHRLGMLLNANELLSLVHIPSASVTSQKLSRQAIKTKRAPHELMQGKYLLGVNTHLGQSHNVYLDDEYKKRHTYIIGNTGTGKSTLILNMLLNDCEVGNGCAIFDPHGDVVDDVLARIPEHRKDDVILFDPSDTNYPIGFNLLEAKTDIERIVLSSDLVEVFKSRSTSWGDQMTSVLSNAVNAFLENEQGGTLLELRRFLLDDRYRKHYLENIQDYSIRSYWEHDFKQLRKGAISPLLTRLDTFLRPRIIRNMMAQKEGIDFHELMNGKKILLVKLSQGLIGEENSYLLGTLILSKLQQAAQARASMAKEARSPFYIYIDEFHNFLTPSMTQILSGARKYGLGLILAHQQVSQLWNAGSQIADSVLSNPAVRICFRVGDSDAKQLANGFSYYDQSDLQNLERGQCIVRVGRNEHDFNLTTKIFDDAPHAHLISQYIIQHTRNTYASSKEDVEKIVQENSQFDVPVASQGKSKVNPIKEEIPKEKDAITKLQSFEDKPKLHNVDSERKIDIEQSAKDFIELEETKIEIREHIYLQHFTKQIAEQLGFKVSLEEMVANGKVDVSLVKDSLKIACEISVSNTVEYEVKNIQKCFQNDYTFVVMISNNVKHLNKIKNQVLELLNEVEKERIRFIESNSLSATLQEIEKPYAESQESVKRVIGYRVYTRYKTKDINSVNDINLELNKIILKPNVQGDELDNS